MAEAPGWWRDAVIYQVYVRSFSDSDGDGLGDLGGIRSRLGYLRDLGVDGLWLTPFYPSPLVDGGYDVADPRDVDPALGSLDEFDRLVAEAHRLGLRVLVDLVPNHTSDRHPWFQAALSAEPGSPERDRYLFRDGRSGPDGSQLPPNNWQSVFGGSAWAPDERTGQWFLHLFAPEQPDLNWRNADVVADAERTLRFWLDRGVDGFRIDVAHGLIKSADLPDNPGAYSPELFGHGPEEVHSWDQPEVHDVYRRWRKVLDSYPGERMAVGEVWVRTDEATARYVRPDELHLAFNFRLLRAPWEATALRDAVTASLASMAGVGAPSSWVLSNHDAVRHRSRYGDGEIGLRRARAAALLLLALPGAAYLYQGEELGLPEVRLPDEALQDPIWLRSGRTTRGRDGCRVPLPWQGTAAPYGFSAGADSWLPMPEDWAALTVEAQTVDPGSVLELYRSALRLRREARSVSGAPRAPALFWEDSPPDCLVLHREDGLVCAVNLGSTDVPMPAGTLLLHSADPETVGTAVLPADSAAWLRRAG